MFQRALICTDLSDGLHRLAQFVPSLAASGFKQIVFLNILQISDDREIPRLDPEVEQAARDRLSPALQDIPDGVEVNIEVQPGKPIDTIQRVVQSTQSDLVILGMPTRSLLNEKLFGSTTLGFCQRSQVPVLTLRPQLVSTYTTEELDLRCRHLCRYLLIPYDGTDASDYTIDRIANYAQSRPANSLQYCLLCWVFEDLSRRSLPREFSEDEAQNKLDGIKQRLEALGLTVYSEIRHGNPLSEIMEAAMEYDIQAIATSSDSLGSWLGWSVPSFAQEVLRRSWHPVLYVPSDR